MDQFVSSEAYAKLSTKVQPDSEGNVYLNSDDLSSILRDFVTRLVAKEVMDAGYVDAGMHWSASRKFAQVIPFKNGFF